MLPLYNDRRFNLVNWREIIQNSGVKILNDRCQSITPFGFEVTKDTSYLYKNLNRFYCYVSSPEIKTRSLETEKRFAKELLNEIEISDKSFYNRISVIVYEHDKKGVDLIKDFSDNSILINIEQRVCDDLIIDYAQYLACCLFEIENDTLQEFHRFHDNLNVRNRCYQLYLIIECATHYLNIPFSEEEKHVFLSLHTLNKSKIEHYYTSTKHIDSTDNEKNFYNIIKNRLHKIFQKVISNNENTKTITIKAYNSDNIIQCDIPLTYYNHFVDFIVETYNEFR